MFKKFFVVAFILFQSLTSFANAGDIFENPRNLPQAKSKIVHIYQVRLNTMISMSYCQNFIRTKLGDSNVYEIAQRTFRVRATEQQAYEMLTDSSDRENSCLYRMQELDPALYPVETSI